MSDQPFPEKIYAAFFEHEYPADFAIMAVWLAAGLAAIYLPVLSDTPLWIVLALPVILFIPGYCLMVALFPKKGDLRLIERIILSVGLSVAIFSLIGLVVYFTQGVFQIDKIVIFLIFFTLVIINIAYVRRASVPYDSRFRVPFSTIFRHIRQIFLPPDESRVDQLITVLLTLVILISLMTTIFVLAAPREGERFTEFYLLGEKQTAADYPDYIIAGQNYPVYIGVGNHENREASYTIETWLLHTEFDNVTNTSRIISTDPLDRLSLNLAHNETRIIPYNLSIKKTGFDRLEFLLFNENVPGFEVNGSDRINASYRNLHLWVTIEEPES